MKSIKSGFLIVLDIEKNMLDFLYSILARIPKSEDGQNRTDYALLVVLIIIVVIAVIVFFGDEISEFLSSLFTTVSDWFIP